MTFAQSTCVFNSFSECCFLCHVFFKKIKMIFQEDRMKNPVSLSTSQIKMLIK